MTYRNIKLHTITCLFEFKLIRTRSYLNHLEFYTNMYLL